LKRIRNVKEKNMDVLECEEILSKAMTEHEMRFMSDIKSCSKCNYKGFIDIQNGC
jgi:hypothetical protein